MQKWGYPFEGSREGPLRMEMKMPKMKTRRGSAKRFTKTGTGKLRRRRAYHSHILTKKTTKRKRRLRKGAAVCKSDVKILKGCLPYL